MSTTRRRTLLRRGRHDSGASAVEYALILAGVGLVSIGAIYALNRSAEAAYVNASNNMQGTSVTATPSTSVLPSVSVTPTTTSATPTTSSATPTTSSASPTPTVSVRPTTDEDARRGRTTEILNLSGTVTNTSVSMTPDVGSIRWDGNDIEITVDNDRDLVGEEVTVTYSYTQGGQQYTGTIIVTITN